MSSLTKKFKPSDAIVITEQSTKLMMLNLRKQEDPEESGDMISKPGTQYLSPIEENRRL